MKQEDTSSTIGRSGDISRRDFVRAAGPVLAGLTIDGFAGVVQAVRDGNTVTVDAYHVRRLRLLISPDAFDIRSPIRVIANGDVAFEGLVEPSAETLRKWAAIDEDRTMLYAAEISVELELGSR